MIPFFDFSFLLPVWPPEAGERELEDVYGLVIAAADTQARAILRMDSFCIARENFATATAPNPLCTVSLVGAHRGGATANPLRLSRGLRNLKNARFRAAAGAVIQHEAESKSLVIKRILASQCIGFDLLFVQFCASSCRPAARIAKAYRREPEQCATPSTWLGQTYTHGKRLQ